MVCNCGCVMWFPEGQLRIWLYNRPTDMRKSFDGLSALARSALQENPVSGQVFVFINRRKTQLKALYFDRGGYCLWSKRLEQGLFHAPSSPHDKLALSASDLRLLLDGIEGASVKRFKRYCGPNSTSEK